MNDEMKEYITFFVTDKSGNQVEMAVIDEFQYEHKDYVVSALVKDDTVDEEGIFIYRVKPNSDELEVEKITNTIEYQKIAEAYLAME